MNRSRVKRGGKTDRETKKKKEENWAKKFAIVQPWVSLTLQDANSSHEIFFFSGGSKGEKTGNVAGGINQVQRRGGEMEEEEEEEEKGAQMSLERRGEREGEERKKN